MLPGQLPVGITDIPLPRKHPMAAAASAFRLHEGSSIIGCIRMHACMPAGAQRAHVMIY